MRCVNAASLDVATTRISYFSFPPNLLVGQNGEDRVHVGKVARGDRKHLVSPLVGPRNVVETTVVHGLEGRSRVNQKKGGGGAEKEGMTRVFTTREPPARTLRDAFIGVYLIIQGDVDGEVRQRLGSLPVRVILVPRHVAPMPRWFAEQLTSTAPSV